MHVVALDLGTKCGWASRESKRGITSGTWILATPEEITIQRSAGQDREYDQRFPRLINRLNDLDSICPIDAIWFEDVQFSTYTMQTQLWSSLRAAVWSFHYLNPMCATRCLAVGSLKKSGAGHGGATKLMMAASLMKKHPDLYKKPSTKRMSASVLLESVADNRAIDDNEIDALHLLEYACPT